eukprot:247236-Chlamydomonas_euryale.AAC.1
MGWSVVLCCAMMCCAVQRFAAPHCIVLVKDVLVCTFLTFPSTESFLAACAQSARASTCADYTPVKYSQTATPPHIRCSSAAAQQLCHPPQPR